MQLRREYLDKADPLLREALEKASGEETVRALLVLQGEGPERSVPGEPVRPEQFPSRAAYRKALIERQQRQVEREVAAVKQRLEQLSLSVAGGKISRTVVVQGRAASVLRSLELSGVRHASLDRQIDLIEPRRAQRDPDKR